MFFSQCIQICQANITTLQIMDVSEKLCLQWNDFKDNITSSFGELREDKDLTDVTLVCEDGRQVEGHKVILAASSPFFMELLKKNRHPHPLIYMRGLKSENLSAIIDFLYFGEANVLQANLESFLALAEELRLKGLTGPGDPGSKTQEGTAANVESNLRKPPVIKEKLKESKKSFGNQSQTVLDPGTVVVFDNNSTNATPNQLDEQIKSMMTLADVRTSDGHRLATCNICGKEGASNNMPSHIEANHITGVSHSCNICGKISRSRDGLRKHKQIHQKAMLQDKRQYEDAHA